MRKYFFDRKFFRAGLHAFLAAVIFFNAAPVMMAASFSDIPAGHPYYAAVESLKNLGVVKGYADGTFRPDQAVNRAEALKMVLLTAQIQISPGLYQTGFPDVALSDWFSGYVFYGQNLNVINGNPDGTFAPARRVNKAEFLKMAVLTFGIDISPYKTVQFALARDIVNVSEWYVPYFNYAKTAGIVLPTIENKLEPGKFLTRAECAEILYKMYILKHGGQTQELLSAAEAKLVDALIRINDGNFADGLTRAQEALFYTGKALEIEPDSNVVQGANFIAIGFQKLFEAYGAGMENDTEKLRSLAQEAKINADQAIVKNGALYDLAMKLKELADNLLAQAGA